MNSLPLSHQAPPASAANLFAARMIAFTIGTTRLAESIRFYRDLMGYPLVAEGVSPFGPMALLRPHNIGNGGVRLIGLPEGAAANRPRPETRPWDAGLAVMECRTSDPDRSYAQLTAGGAPTLSEPLYYFFRDIAPIPDLDVRSYAVFGPGGEQLFVTANVRKVRPEWDFPGSLHGPLAGAVLVGIDAKPVDEFYDRALGLKRTSDMDCCQASANELIGAPRDTAFRWGFFGERVSIEVEAFDLPDTTLQPTSIERTGLAMITVEVNDIDAVRERCDAQGLSPLDQPVLALDAPPRRGFVLRGAIGELVEIVAAS